MTIESTKRAVARQWDPHPFPQPSKNGPHCGGHACMEYLTAISLALTVETKSEPEGRTGLCGGEKMRDTIIMNDKLNLGIDSFGEHERLRVLSVGWLLSCCAPLYGAYRVL